jgi:hypothetical protein
VNTSADEVRAAFATLAPFRDGRVFSGRFPGDTPWERHRKGDDLVQILDGAATLHGAERDAAAHRAHRGRGSEGRSLATLGADDGQADQA